MIKIQKNKKVSAMGFLSLFIFFSAAMSLAQPEVSLLKQKRPHTSQSVNQEFYMIVDPLNDDSSEEESAKSVNNSMNPIAVVKAFASQAMDINAPVEFNLLEWIHQRNHEDDDYEPYNRKSQFGGWIKDPQHKTCLNVRGLVLIRDAHDEIVYDENNECRVKSSEWTDPYTHEELYSADDIQIDHVVPLKDAYISGAWKWSNPKRCTYANFLGNNFHLLPVLGTENSKKGDSAPDEYIPPYKSFVCQYILDWLKIKSIWNLKMSADEAEGIKEDLKDFSCSPEEFKLSIRELQKQRSLSMNIPSGCAHR